MIHIWTHSIDMDSCYRHGLMIESGTHGMDMGSWYIWTHGIGNTHGTDSNSLYNIDIPLSHIV